MRFSDKKIWKQTSHQKSEETFLGCLRAKTNRETEETLRPMLPVKETLKNGVYFTTYPDGHIEIETVFERLQKMVKEI